VALSSDNDATSSSCAATTSLLNQKDREATIRAFSNEIGLMMNIMAVSLNKTAAKLRIEAEPVKVDRSKLL
jgi:hypothetical protein